MGRPFIWLEGERGGWATAVVCHDGGGCGRFRRGSARAVVGSDEGASGGGTHTHTHEATVVASAVRPREEDDQAGPACRW
jgi:hypothetical protein